MKKDFPILSDEKTAYLDNSATTQKPAAVLDAVSKYYREYNANPLRGTYDWSVRATAAFENARQAVQKFINARKSEEVIFTKNASESLNLAAYSYAMNNLQPGDEILISVSEHHSNLVPWQIVA